MSAESLNTLLTRLGHPPILQRPDLRPFGYDTQAEPYTGDWAMFEPLMQRGWCTHFDAEGQFFVPGEHTKLIKALLTLAGVSPLPQVRDTWVVNVGWVLEVWDDQRRLSYHTPESGRDLPSDYCDLCLIKALIEDWLEGACLLLEPNTDDQTAFCCMIPRPVYGALCTEGFIDPEAEEMASPSPDELVIQPAWHLEDAMASIERLTPAAAEAMLREAPRDWLAGCGDD
jgi:hypothetical protein